MIRDRALGRGVREELRIFNHGTAHLPVTLEIELDADFRDLFAVKENLPPLGETRCVCETNRIVFDYQHGGLRRRTLIEFGEPVQLVPGNPHRGVLRRTIAPKQTWRLHVDLVPVTDREHRAKYGPGVRDRPRPEMDESFEEWLELPAKLDTGWEPLRRTYARSIEDLGALRFFPGPGEGAVPAAGLPWFMALFGRDALIVSLQTLPFLPELAHCTLNALARRQALHDDAFRDAEPGKILHEERHGELTLCGHRPHSPYYGTVDATPLFLVLLEEYERWTGDRALVARLEPNARAALQWLNRHDPLVSYRTRSAKGLENQCWKDSWNSMQFRDGTLATPPVSVIEVQGYAIAAYRAAAQLARRVWQDRPLARHALARGRRLRRAMNRLLWLPGEGHYALALDGDGRALDSLTSNIGHLLWSGVVSQGRGSRLCELLMAQHLFSGWGIRSLSTLDAGYNPIGYHHGTVWPHDNSLIAAGLTRYGFRREANCLATAMLEAAAHFDYRLPEVFAGYAREETGFPVEYPTASSPQAWASGAPLLLLSAVLGLRATADHELRAAPALPPGADFIALRGIRHCGSRYAIYAGRAGWKLERL